MSDLSSTLLPQTNNPEEIQRAILDLLSKIQGKTRVITTAKPITIPDGKDNLFIDVTTGTNEIPIIIGSPKINTDREITVLKNLSSGTGEVKIIAKINGYTNIYVGLPGQHVTFKAREKWTIIGGVIQPRALEPDIGGGLHLFQYDGTTRAIVNGVAGAAAWSAAVSCSTYILGGRAVLATAIANTGSAGAGQVDLEYGFDNKVTVVPAFNTHPFVNTTFNAAGASAVITGPSKQVIIPLDSSLQFYYYRYANTNTATPLLYVILLGYYLGV